VWRNEAENSKFLRNVGTISSEMQVKWYNDYLNEKNYFIFAIFECEKLNRIIGSVALYNFRNNTAEIGKIQIGDKAAHGIGAGKISLVIACKIGFELLKLKLIDGHVHKENIAAYKNDISIGFQVVEEHPGAEDYIQITYENLKENNPFWKDVEVDTYE
jgi:RimJ/RimL family protein N-acetyltransferase